MTLMCHESIIAVMNKKIVNKQLKTTYIELHQKQNKFLSNKFGLQAVTAATTTRCHVLLTLSSHKKFCRFCEKMLCPSDFKFQALDGRR